MRLFVLQKKLLQFFQTKDYKMQKILKGINFILHLFYLSDILGITNHCNCCLQGPGSNVVDFAVKFTTSRVGKVRLASHMRIFDSRVKNFQLLCSRKLFCSLTHRWQLFDCSACGDYVLVGRCWTSCNLFPIRYLAVSQHVPSIVQFFIFFQSFPTFCCFVYLLLLRPGTGRFFRNRRCDFQQSSVAMLEFFFLHSFKFACLLKIYIRSHLAPTSLCYL